MSVARGERNTDWEGRIDALEARLARQEAALSGGGGDGSFEAVQLPTGPLSEADRVRVQLALQRIRDLEATIRTVLDRTPNPARSSPYN